MVVVPAGATDHEKCAGITRQGMRALPYRVFYRWCGASGQGRTLPLRTFYRQAHRRGGALPRPSLTGNPLVMSLRNQSADWLRQSVFPTQMVLRRSLPTVVPADWQALSCPPTGALPRNRLASSAAGGASAISPPFGFAVWGGRARGPCPYGRSIGRHIVGAGLCPARRLPPILPTVSLRGGPQGRRGNPHLPSPPNA